MSEWVSECIHCCNDQPRHNKSSVCISHRSVSRAAVLLSCMYRVGVVKHHQLGPLTVLSAWGNSEPPFALPAPLHSVMLCPNVFTPLSLFLCLLLLFQAALRMLSTLSDYLDGDLDRVEQVIKVRHQPTASFARSVVPNDWVFVRLLLPLLLLVVVFIGPPVKRSSRLRASSTPSQTSSATAKWSTAARTCS